MQKIDEMKQPTHLPHVFIPRDFAWVKYESQIQIQIVGQQRDPNQQWNGWKEGLQCEGTLGHYIPSIPSKTIITFSFS